MNSRCSRPVRPPQSIPFISSEVHGSFLFNNFQTAPSQRPLCSAFVFNLLQVAFFVTALFSKLCALPLVFPIHQPISPLTFPCRQMLSPLSTAFTPICLLSPLSAVFTQNDRVVPPLFALPVAAALHCLSCGAYNGRPNCRNGGR